MTDEQPNAQSNAQPKGDTTNAAQTTASTEQLPPQSAHATRHSITLDGTEWQYEATVGTLNIDTEKVKPAASVFYTVFQALDADGKTDPTRPVTFVFNGGPGSSTTFLLLGSLAPRRIAVNDTSADHAPYSLTDNAYTLLPKSDLVFIDAPGAGFSRIAEKAKAELWSVDGDVRGFSAFIRAFLTAYHRWNSPKYVLGESYGTTRGVALSYRLQQDGVSLNGLTLISNILDYGFTLSTSDQYYIGYFPTFASVAKYHGKAASDTEIAEHLQQARAFANGPLRLALAQGATLDPQTKTAVARRYAELTGLSEQYVLDSDLRVLDTRFRKQLLRDKGTIVGRYDGRASGYDLDAVSDDETFVVDDALLAPAYASLVNAYLRDELEWNDTRERQEFANFDWESTEPGKGWTWWHKMPEHTKTSWSQIIPFPKVTGDLAAAICQQPAFKVLVGNGIYDLCTPFNQTEYDIDHMGLPEALRGNIAFTYYPAGHMLYSSQESLKKFRHDLERFYDADVADLPQLNERPQALKLSGTIE
ncbi:MAG: carboxypeptidase [Bifidobacterium tibiigranuli]|jgi:carboxypeptidase C (cathepsin A)|uniref:S10 family peptidase n=1 Tax=Bifidobacterium tibiigranuli TaxID=2172043 RepID=UPI002353CA0C|nr:carboxypeptidase [Bifidobacterium tibiigranuli]MCH3973600.1 carboxypeptidase [Bifidobacterium tibiigranuli]MCH4189742.1 carboxypeptidase [Bifidobacterium tibiigranuli]MCH4204655.1 carboxypeptidase [Bifidobacterium tibiigranuli]MCH4275435.1 carboxypeptidase [Bifidobacterium tibiigranuli]MCI1791894.1 carboxypeptidase [Bifidobacterium tibiigranuli]